MECYQNTQISGIGMKRADKNFTLLFALGSDLMAVLRFLHYGHTAVFSHACIEHDF